jgi:ring-1,2-phenylacetyl-CoA epoxidase subunit PaaD
MVTSTRPASVDLAREIVSRVVDPEIPVVTIADLGILRDVRLEGDRVVVTITPTYSGCPAMTQIADDIRAAVGEHGLGEAEVRLAQHPAWSSDLVTSEGRRKLREFGIAPPAPPEEVLCPRCDSGAPVILAGFGSTACKALMVCSSCSEPFDLFKLYR